MNSEDEFVKMLVEAQAFGLKIRAYGLSQGKSLKPLKIERDLRKMLPQNDRKIEELRKIEGLLAYAVEHNDEAEIRRQKALLDKVVDGN